MNAIVRGKMEQLIVEKFFIDALTSGYRVGFEGQRNFVGGDLPIHHFARTDLDLLMAKTFQDDSATVCLKRNGRTVGHVDLYFGNEDCDVIHDYSRTLEKVLAGAKRVAHQLKMGDFRFVLNPIQQ